MRGRTPYPATGVSDGGLPLSYRRTGGVIPGETELDFSEFPEALAGEVMGRMSTATRCAGAQSATQPTTTIPCDTPATNTLSLIRSSDVDTTIDSRKIVMPTQAATLSRRESGAACRSRRVWGAEIRPDRDTHRVLVGNRTLGCGREPSASMVSTGARAPTHLADTSGRPRQVFAQLPVPRPGARTARPRMSPGSRTLPPAASRATRHLKGSAPSRPRVSEIDHDGHKPKISRASDASPRFLDVGESAQPGPATPRRARARKRAAICAREQVRAQRALHRPRSRRRGKVRKECRATRTRVSANPSKGVLL